MKLSDLLRENPELDHDLEVEDGDIVSDLVVGLRSVRLDDVSGDALMLSAADHTTGIMQYGIVCAMKLQLDKWMQDGEDGD